MERSGAIALLRQHVHDESLIKHCLATGAIMHSVAPPLSGDPEIWQTIGILHDIDFEQVHGDMQRHGEVGAIILKDSGVSDEISEIVRRHNHFLHNGTYEQPVEIALQAADSASGLIIACALVKGGSISDVSVKTIAKKAREKSFAAGCDRTRIAQIATIMDISVFYDYALQGMLDIKNDLGLR